MPKLSDFQAMLFDVDRTLSTTDMVVPEEVIKQLNTAIEQDITVGVCTGRSYPAIEHYVLPKFPPDALHILSGGAELSTSDGKVLHATHIAQEVVTANLQTLATTHKTLFFTHQTMFLSDEYLHTYQDHPWDYTVKPISEYAGEPVTLICAIGITPQNTNLVAHHTQLSIKYLTTNDGRPYVDMTPAGVTKATGIHEWCKQTRIPPEKIIGFGDSENDLEFLTEVGFAVAMGNADNHIKHIADRTIGHVNENGLSNYLSEILAGKDL